MTLSLLHQKSFMAFTSLLYGGLHITRVYSTSSVNLTPLILLLQGGRTTLRSSSSEDMDQHGKGKHTHKYISVQVIQYTELNKLPSLIWTVLFQGTQ